MQLNIIRAANAYMDKKNAQKKLVLTLLLLFTLLIKQIFNILNLHLVPLVKTIRIK